MASWREPTAIRRVRGPRICRGSGRDGQSSIEAGAPTSGRSAARRSGIVLVLACAAAAVSMSFSVQRSLDVTREDYYRHHGFADLFASVPQRPCRLSRRCAASRGVEAAAARIVGYGAISIDWLRRASHRPAGIAAGNGASGQASPCARQVARARSSGGGRGQRRLCDGPRSWRGSRFALTIGGHRRVHGCRRRSLAEFIFALGPGKIVPDDRRFGIVWMERAELATALGLADQINDLAIRLSAGASAAARDRGACPPARLPCRRRYSRSQPAIFACLRLEPARRAWRYRCPPAGHLPGCRPLSPARVDVADRRVAEARDRHRQGVGLRRQDDRLALRKIRTRARCRRDHARAARRRRARLRRDDDLCRILPLPLPALWPRHRWPCRCRRGPRLRRRSGLRCILRARRRAFGRPSPCCRPRRSPTGGSPANAWRSTSRGWLSMVLRQLGRRPLRPLLTMLAVAFAAGLQIATLFSFDALDEMVDVFYARAQRQDATIVFAAPLPATVLTDLARWPGVRAVEGRLDVPARLDCRRHVPTGRSHRPAGGRHPPTPARSIACAGSRTR